MTGFWSLNPFSTTLTRGRVSQNGWWCRWGERRRRGLHYWVWAWDGGREPRRRPTGRRIGGGTSWDSSFFGDQSSMALKNQKSRIERARGGRGRRVPKVARRTSLGNRKRERKTNDTTSPTQICTLQESDPRTRGPSLMEGWHTHGSLSHVTSTQVTRKCRVGDELRASSWFMSGRIRFTVPRKAIRTFMHVIYGYLYTLFHGWINPPNQWCI